MKLRRAAAGPEEGAWLGRFPEPTPGSRFGSYATREKHGMDTGGDKLLVRQFERVQCQLDAEVEPAPESRGQVRLARGVGDGSGRVKAVMTDCSGGGMGLRCPVFFPKHGVLNVRVTDGKGGMLFEGKVRVQRATMVGREPSYELGGAFVEGAVGVAGRLGTLIDFAKAQGDGTVGGARA